MTIEDIRERMRLDAAPLGYTCQECGSKGVRLTDNGCEECSEDDDDE